MSKALYDTGQLRFWTEHEIELREWFIKNNAYALRTALLAINKGWTFHRIEGPLLTPHSFINPAYGPDDVWWTQGMIADQKAVMRPETTESSYLYARSLLKQSPKAAPLCVWQAGKSFRRENNDGASASKLRFFEFWQQEFQCVYPDSTHADYRTPIEQAIKEALEYATGTYCNIVPSDRLPSYSEKTNDIEVEYKGRWTEMASISTRTDFGPGYKVLEVAIGLDRLVCTRFPPE